MIKLGIERINEYSSIFAGKRVGLITNPTGMTSDFRSSIDVLKEKTNLVALFSPEHGVRGNIQAGEKLEAYFDSETGCIVHSLYGKDRKPTKEMMDGIDVLCMDIQDAGSRFYTYIYTMAYAMTACKEYDKEFVIFDRPNPASAKEFEGNILDLKFRSFVGYYPILQRYGLTIAELAKMFNTEYEINCKLHTILMKNYKREMYYPDTKLPWVMPSPNFPTPMTALVYNATCIFEGTNLSEGRGTTAPFHYVGAPWINPVDYAEKLNSYKLPGVHFRALYFTPMFSKNEKLLCGGVEVHVLDVNKFKAVKVGWLMLYVVRKMYPNDFKVLPPYTEGRPCMLEFNTGCDYIKEDKYEIDKLFSIIDKETKIFAKTRKKYLLY